MRTSKSPVSPLAFEQSRSLENILREGFTLSFQQAVASLGTLQFAVHLAQGLPSWKDGLSLSQMLVLAIVLL